MACKNFSQRSGSLEETNSVRTSLEPELDCLAILKNRVSNRPSRNLSKFQVVEPLNLSSTERERPKTSTPLKPGGRSALNQTIELSGSIRCREASLRVNSSAISCYSMCCLDQDHNFSKSQAEVEAASSHREAVQREVGWADEVTPVVPIRALNLPPPVPTRRQGFVNRPCTTSTTQPHR